MKPQLFKVAAAILSASLLFSAINYKIFASFRINDFLILTAFLILIIGNFKIRKTLLAWLIMFPVIICASILLSADTIDDGNADGVVFIYKYMLIPIVVTLFFSLASRIESVENFSTSTFLLFIVLSIWPYVYLFLLSSGVVSGALRPSFPASDDYNFSDAHLYCNTLAVLWLFYIFHYARINAHTPFVRLLLTVVCFGAMILTGSRNGFVVIVVGTVLTSFLGLWSVRNILTVRFIILLLLLSVTAAAFYYANVEDDMLNNINHLYERSTNFSLGDDESSIGRIIKINEGINLVLDKNIVFGVGPFSASRLWYDNGPTIIFVHLGLMGLIIIIFPLLIWGFNLYRGDYHHKLSLVILFCYIISNIITEFFLVTRSLLPAVACILIPYFYSSSNKKHN